MRKLIFLAFLFLLFIPVQKASAHVGGGPPFLLIDGKYVATDPYFTGSGLIDIPQDYNADTYIVGSPIELKIDTTKLLVPADIANNSTYRWTIQDKPNTVIKTGKSIIYSFKKPGSYMIILDVLAPGESQYVNIDTTQVDVLPNASYKRPEPKIAVATDNLQSTKPIKFIGSATVDPSAKLTQTLWDFGDGNSGTSLQALHTYSTFSNYTTYFVVFRAIDSNGLISDIGVIVESVKGNLVFYDKKGNKNTIPISKNLNQSTVTSSGSNTELIVGGVFIAIALVLILVVTFITLHKKK